MHTLVFDRTIVELPLRLNPVVVASLQLPTGVCSRARFKTDLIATYHPNVPSSTPGTAFLACAQDTLSTEQELSAAQPHARGTVWKKFSLPIKKTLLQSRQWFTQADSSPWLSGYGLRGAVTLSGTLQVCTVLRPSAPLTPPAPIEIRTEAAVGPRIAGFSLCYYGTTYPQLSSTGGQVINIDLQASTGWTTSARFVRTPENRPYVVVRYGFPGFEFIYSYANRPLQGWYNNGAIIQTYNNTSNTNAGDKPSYWASWAKIRGSTSWWCETKPQSYNPSTGTHTPLYRPYAVLFLYYDYGSVDIFDSSFDVSPTITPSLLQPDPGPDHEPGETVPLTLNGYIPFLLASSKWNPFLTEQEVTQKEELTSWPVKPHDELRRSACLPCRDDTTED